MADPNEAPFLEELRTGPSIHLRILCYPLGDWYGDLERKRRSKATGISTHRIRELALFVSHERNTRT